MAATPGAFLLVKAPPGIGLGPGVGIGLNLCGSTLINLGSNLIKLAHIKRLNEKRSQILTLRRAASSSNSTTQSSVLQAEEVVGAQRCAGGVAQGRLWLAGWCLFITGNFLNFASFSFTTQSLLAPLGSVQFVTNVAFGRVVLGRRISPRMYAGTAVLIVGIVLVVLFASKTDTVHKYSLDELQSLMLRLHYIVYVAVLLVFFLAASVVQSCTKIESRTIRAMAYAMSSAVIGAQSVTFFKILSELVAVLADSSDRITRSAVVTSPFTYVVVIAAISTCVFWMYRLNDGLRRFDALLIIPLFQVLWVTISTIGGGIYFKEFQEFTLEMGLLFVLGLSVVFLGVYLLSTSPTPRLSQQKDYRRLEDGENIVSVGRQNSLTMFRERTTQVVLGTGLGQGRNQEESGSTMSSQNSTQRPGGEYVTVTSIHSAMPAVGQIFPSFMSQEEHDALVSISARVSTIHFSFGMPMISAVHHDILSGDSEHPPLQRSDTM